jgi:hypothetical protein
MPTPLPSLPPESIAENASVMELEAVLSPSVTLFSKPSMEESIVVVGGSVSTVHENDSGEEFMFPMLSSEII